VKKSPPLLRRATTLAGDGVESADDVDVKSGRVGRQLYLATPSTICVNVAADTADVSRSLLVV